jgi:hypothetical protein
MVHLSLQSPKEASEIKDVLTQNITLGGGMTNTIGCVFLGHRKGMKVNVMVQGWSGEWGRLFFSHVGL